ncbi:MAG: ribonuclease E inhibitor RraB [Sphingomonas sp.]
MSAVQIDPLRWNEVWSADCDVLRNLAEQGDRPEVPRLVDVSFRGSAEALDRLEAAACNFGFTVQARDPDGADEPWLFLERVQKTDIETMRDFTTTYLQIEDAFGVECDGWGCIAQNGIGD